MMTDKIYLKKWKIKGDKVKLIYEDRTVVFVSKVDFDRAFGCICSAPKADIIRDFAITQ